MFTAVIPKYHKEFACNADQDFIASKPCANANKVVCVRINEAGSGILKLDMAGATVPYDGCVDGEIMVGEYKGLTASGTDVTSIIVSYV